MPMQYTSLKKIRNLPRLPFMGSIDLTYRCNNNCRHCWLSLPSKDKAIKNELSFEEIKNIIDEARQMGCRSWVVSGGEPMLRPDFAEIFDYITTNSTLEFLNTNGTLITPKIAKLLKRKGTKRVAIYGATPDVHDHITRNPGSFEQAMQGIAYLKEAGVCFKIQIIPMRDNYHQFKDMMRLAGSLSPYWSVGAEWLFLSADGNVEKNEEIRRQRLSPKEVVVLNKPDIAFEDWIERESASCYLKTDNRLFASCVISTRSFYVTPYGQMTLCCFIRNPDFFYDLRKGDFRKGWELFIPSLLNKVKGGLEYLKNCGSCELRKDCNWCPAYAYLESRNYSAKVDYLCKVAQERHRYKEIWKKEHCRYYKIAGVTIQIESDLPITKDTFKFKFKKFEVIKPGKDIITIRHHFSLPNLDGKNLGTEVYRRPPWAIYKNRDSWIYLGIYPEPEDKRLHRIIVFNQDYSRATIYNKNKKDFLKGGSHSLTLFPSDQMLLTHILADRKGCYLHSCGIKFKNKGLLFVGHSGAGKTTIATILKDKAEILCDERIIVRKQNNGFKIYGTWSHGEFQDVSAGSTPLEAILFLEKARSNSVIVVNDKKERIRRIMECLIKPLVNAGWWRNTLTLIDELSVKVPCYILRFNKNRGIIDILEQL